MKVKGLVFLAIICIVFVICASLIPYVLIDSFSNHNDSLGTFGTYLSGVSSLLNVLVFVAITFVIQRLDSRRKITELDILQKREVFNRYLSSYEKLIANLFSLKTTLVIAIKKIENNENTLEISELLDIYVTIKTMYQYSIIYIMDEMETLTEENIPDTVQKFIEDDFYALISIIDNNEDKETLIRQIKKTNMNIDNVITITGEITKEYIGGGFVGKN